MSRRNSNRWVYLIGSPTSHAVKIGVSNRPEDRLLDLQVGSPVALALMWKTRGGQGLESALHAYFAPYRTHGEWFDFGDEHPVALVATAAVLMGHRAQPDRVSDAARYRYGACTSCAERLVRQLADPADIVIPPADLRFIPKQPKAPIPTMPNFPATHLTNERVLATVQNGPVRQKEIAEASGLPKGTVSKVVKRLAAAGRLVRLDDGTVSLPTTGTVSA